MRTLIDRITARHILWLCLASAVARTVFVFGVAPPIQTAEDFSIARNIVAGKGFSIYDRGPTTIKGPIYPAYLAAAFWLFGEHNGLRVAVWLQHVVVACMPWLLLRLGIAIRCPVLGKAAALLIALHPSYFYHPTVAENTAWVVTIGAAWCVMLFSIVPPAASIWRVVLLGAIVGVFVLEKPPLVVPMLAALVLHFRLCLRWVLVVGIGALLVVLPWSVRSYVAFGQWSVTKTYSGYLTFIHSWLPAMAVHPRYAVTSGELDREIDSLGRLPEAQALPRLRALAANILAEKWQLLPERTLVHALVYWTIPPRYWGNWSLAFVVGRVVPVGVLLVLMIWGTHVLWRTDRVLLVSIGAVLAWVTLFYSLYHVLNIRYKLEIEWLQLFICAAAIVGGAKTEMPRTTAS